MNIHCFLKLAQQIVLVYIVNRKGLKEQKLISNLILFDHLSITVRLEEDWAGGTIGSSPMESTTWLSTLAKISDL